MSKKCDLILNMLLVIAIIIDIITIVYVMIQWPVSLMTIMTIIFGIMTFVSVIMGVKGNSILAKMTELINSFQETNAKSLRHLNESSNKEARINRYRHHFINKMRSSDPEYLLLETFVIDILLWTGREPDYHSDNKPNGYRFILARLMSDYADYYCSNYRYQKDFIIWFLDELGIKGPFSGNIEEDEWSSMLCKSEDNNYALRHIDNSDGRELLFKDKDLEVYISIDKEGIKLWEEVN